MKVTSTRGRFRSMRSKGNLASARSAATEVRQRLGWWLDARFDRRFGTDTSGIVPVDRLGIAGASVGSAVHYEASPTRVFLRALAQTVPDPERYVFIDYGSGKGRALLLASHFAFKRIVGIELSPSLHAIAQRNIELYRSKDRRCFDVTSICGDAADFELPADDLVLYFFTPFHEPVLTNVLRRIDESFVRHPRRLIVVAYSLDVDDIVQMAALRCITGRREIKVPRDPTRVVQRRLFVFTCD